jgi:histidyl-tRNA synthetase
MAAHVNELYLPFKRFHMAKVFRGENTQRGRYREFVQCDFDIVGTDAASADFEIVLMIDCAFRAIGVERARVHIAHRGVFNALLAKLGVTEGADEVLRLVDKLRKVGSDEVRTHLAELVGADAADAVLRLVLAEGSNAEVLAHMRSLVPGAADHLDRLEAILSAADALGIADRVVLDPTITRGLDYYTGFVFETFLDELPEIGSVCSGGRYDNLAGLYTKERIPGVGGSIGLDRLMAGLEELGLATPSVRGADAIVLCLDEALTGHYHAIATRLRDEGLRVEVFPEAKKLGQQFAFAEKKGIPAAILCGETERAAGTVNVRELATRTSAEGITLDAAAAEIRRIGG